MAKSKPAQTQTTQRKKIRPALTPEARENQLISLATDLAEQQLLAGTASSQVITYFLNKGSQKERLERERLEEENKLLRAKTKTLEDAAKSEKMYAEALKAFKGYSGQISVEEMDEDEDDEY